MDRPGRISPVDGVRAADERGADENPRPANPHGYGRDYRTTSGRRPVKQFLDRLSDGDAAEVVAAMDEAVKRGIRAVSARLSASSSPRRMQTSRFSCLASSILSLGVFCRFFENPRAT